MQETQLNGPGHTDAPCWHCTRRGYGLALSALDDITSNLRVLLMKSEASKIKAEQIIAAIENHLWDELCQRNGQGPSREA
jgi:hypothetical protein